jgi:uncharacterized protein (TIGR02145 family)
MESRLSTGRSRGCSVRCKAVRSGKSLKRHLMPGALARLGTCLLLGFGLASCSSSLPPRLPPAAPLSRQMPDGKHWTLANLSAEVPESYCYDDEPANCERYGRLYTWETAQTACRSLGSSWRLPSMEDWKKLAQSYGGLFGDGPGNGKVAYRELLAGGRSGLEMLLGGGRQDDGYARLEAHGFYWSTSEESPTSARLLNFGKGSGAVYDQNGGGKRYAYSVRCVAGGR